MNLSATDVVIASPSWSLSGVNVFSANLVRGLADHGIPARVLLTAPQRIDQGLMPIPFDIPVDKLPVNQQDNWPMRWQAMIRYLERLSPCIYIPNYDWDYSCVSPRLSQGIVIVGIVHSDEPVHYEHVSRLGNYWNAIACVSQAIEKKTVTVNPHLVQRVFTVSHGVSVPNNLPEKSLSEDKPLKIVYAGRLVQYQKQVFDLPKIIQTLLEMRVPIELTVAGSGTDQQALMSICQNLIENGAIRFLGTLSNEQVLKIFEQSDVFIMTSDFEGMPVSLLEAMGHGCIPVVTDIESGIPELVHDGENGYRVPVGDIKAFANCLATLQRDLNKRREMSSNAYRTICEGGYRIQDMVDSYIKLFHKVRGEVESGSYRRPRGKILPPSYLQVSWKSRLSTPVRAVGRYGKRILTRSALKQN